MNIETLHQKVQKCSAKNEKHSVKASRITAKKGNLRAVIQRSACHVEISQIGSCCNGFKGEKDIRIYFLQCTSNCFSGALVTYVKGLTCLNRETQSQMTFHSKHLFKCFLKTVHNAEQSMNHQKWSPR